MPRSFASLRVGSGSYGQSTEREVSRDPTPRIPHTGIPHHDFRDPTPWFHYGLNHDKPGKCSMFGNLVLGALCVAFACTLSWCDGHPALSSRLGPRCDSLCDLLGSWGTTEAWYRPKRKGLMWNPSSLFLQPGRLFWSVMHQPCLKRS